MRFQQLPGKKSKELTTTPFTYVPRAKISTFPVAVVNFYFSFKGLLSLWSLCSFFHWLISLLRCSIWRSWGVALVNCLAGRKWFTLIFLKDTNVFLVQFNGYLLMCRLSSTCAYYKANTQTQKQYLYTKTLKKQNKNNMVANSNIKEVLRHKPQTLKNIGNLI